MKKILKWGLLLFLFILPIQVGAKVIGVFHYSFVHYGEEHSFEIYLRDDGTLFKEYEDGEFFTDTDLIHYFGSSNFDQEFLSSVYRDGRFVQNIPALYYCKEDMSSVYYIYNQPKFCGTEVHSSVSIEGSVIDYDVVEDSMDVTVDDRVKPLCNNYSEFFFDAYRFCSDGTNGVTTKNLSANSNSYVQWQANLNNGIEGTTSIIEDPNLCKDGNCDVSLSELCQYARVKNALKFFGIILFLVKIFVPFLIIILGSVDFIKAMLDGKTDEISKKLPIFMKRLIIGILIFLIPSIINFLFGVIDTYSETMSKYEECRVCIFNPNNCK